MIIIGVVFLARNMGWSDWSIGDIIPYIWPIIIILVGINMLRRPSRKRRKQDVPPSDDWKSYDGYGDGDVPPAPPLHPGPTDPFSPEQEHKQAGSVNGAPFQQNGFEGGKFKINLEKEQPVGSVWKEQAKQHYRDQRKEWKQQYREQRKEWKNEKITTAAKASGGTMIRIHRPAPISLAIFISAMIIGSCSQSTFRILSATPLLI